MLRRYLGTVCKAQPCRRCFSVSSTLQEGNASRPFDSPTDSNGREIKDIAVLGGGITGLSSAYFAALLYPNANVTLFESSDRLGGWLRSTEHDVSGGKVIFEQGPRSLRPSEGTLAMIVQLGLEKDLLVTTKDSDAARNRYIYFDNRIVQVGGGLNFSDVIQEPLIRSAVLEIIETFFKTSRRASDVSDETIGDFFRRRGCPGLANNLVSAMMHGIYAGDIDELSVHSILPTLATYEERLGSPFNYFRAIFLSKLGIQPQWQLNGYMRGSVRDWYANDVLKDVSQESRYLSASVYTLRGGLQNLAEALIQNLRGRPQVKLMTGAFVEQIGPDKDKSDKAKASLKLRDPQKKVSWSSWTPKEFDRIISTIPSTSLASVCSPLKNILGNETATTVCVVNLFYSEPNIKPVTGFGYLIPKSTPRTQNPEGALGVVFDTDATPELDSAPGTKLTVMLGGPFWKGVARDQLPSNDEAISMARSVLASHLGITAEPRLAQANLHANCIPQYTVGYRDKMWRAAQAMMESDEHWRKCVRVAGSSYGGVGVNDCIQNAFVTTAYLNSNSWFGNEAAVNPYRVTAAPA